MRAKGSASLMCHLLMKSSAKHTPDCLIRHAVISGNLAKGFMILTDTVHRLRPFFRRDAVLRLT